jgi:hypothetical protein
MELFAEPPPTNIANGSVGRSRTTTLTGAGASGSRRSSLRSPVIRPARDKSNEPRVAPGPLFRRGVRPPSTQNVDYLLLPFLAALSSRPVPALPWPARVAIRRERRADRLTSRLGCRRVRSFMAVGGTPQANPCETTGLCPGAATVRRARHRCRNPNSTKRTKQRIPQLEPFRTISLACRPGCSLAYFQPCRVRSGQFPGRHSKHQVAVVRPKRSASIAAVSTF